MASFNQIANGFKNSVQYHMNNLENEFINATEQDADIDDLEASLNWEVQGTKQVVNDRIDELQVTITNRRPNPNSPNYARERANYVELLRQSVSGMDSLKAWFQNIFNRIKQIVVSIINWIVSKIVSIAQRIRDAFKSLFRIFF